MQMNDVVGMLLLCLPEYWDFGYNIKKKKQ